MKQYSFGFFGDFKKEFGGDLNLGKRKNARPLSVKAPLHLNLKSTTHRLFNPYNRTLEKTLRSLAGKYHIKIYDLAFNWSHIHLVISIPSRDAYKEFIRTLTAALVRVLSKQKGLNLKGLFDLCPYTKILSWGRQFENAVGYMTTNQLEALGRIKRDKKSMKTSKRDSHSQVSS